MKTYKLQWYNLPEKVRDKLTQLSTEFYALKDQGMWVYPNPEYEPEAIAILRTHNTLSYDIFMPTVFNMMQNGVLTAVFPVGMKVMDIVFYQYDKNNRFHNSAYYRAGLENKLQQ